jgi:hypothetical protein
MAAAAQTRERGFQTFDLFPPRGFLERIRILGSERQVIHRHQGILAVPDHLAPHTHHF